MMMMNIAALTRREQARINIRSCLVLIPPLPDYYATVVR
jgi:hypothetical protein